MRKAGYLSAILVAAAILSTAITYSTAELVARQRAQAARPQRPAAPERWFPDAIYNQPGFTTEASTNATP